jgi:chromate transporter
MLVAVAVVGQAVLGMARSMCPDPPRAMIAVLAIGLAIFVGGAAGQIGAIVMGALAGLAISLVARPGPGISAVGHQALPAPVSARTGAILLVLVPILLAVLWLLETWNIGGTALAEFSAFYRSGALVFGGGHVVLPMLDQAVVARGWVSEADFLAGYGAAQAVPGPLFSFAAFLGAIGPPPNRWPGAVIALLAIFLPGMLLVLGALPFWEAIRGLAKARAALSGINAAVVGILAAALYDPVWTSAVHTPADFLVAAASFALLVSGRIRPAVVVVLATIAGALLATP